MNRPIDDRKKLAIRALGTARAKAAIAEGETRAKLAMEEAEATVEAVIAEAEARVRALMAESYQRAQALARRIPGTPTLSDGENTRPEPVAKAPSPEAGPDPFRKAVSVRAYYKAEKRGFEPGQEVKDWLDAERELMAPTS